MNADKARQFRNDLDECNDAIVQFDNLMRKAINAGDDVQVQTAAGVLAIAANLSIINRIHIAKLDKLIESLDREENDL